MTDDVVTRMEQAATAQESWHADLQPSELVLARMQAGVRRRRATRLAQQGAVAAAVVAVAAVGVWAGLRPDAVPPADPTPAPSSAATPTTSATPLERVDLPGLPAMHRLPDGLLDTTGPGWFVVAYGDPLNDGVDPTSTTLALSAPTGELYHLVDVEDLVVVERWVDATTVRARVGGPERQVVADVDLRTGEVVVDQRVPQAAELVGTVGDDDVRVQRGLGVGVAYVVPRHGDAREVPLPFADGILSPDGTLLASSSEPQVVDLATGAVARPATPAGRTCDVTSWLDATGLLAMCSDAPPTSGEPAYYDRLGARLVRLDTAGGAPQDLAPVTGDGLVPYVGAWVRDGVAAVVGIERLSTSGDCYDACTGGTYLWSAAGAQRVGQELETDGDQVCEAAPGGDGLLLRVGTCFFEIHRSQWWTLDPATGATRLVAPQAATDDGPLVQPASVAERTR